MTGAPPITLRAYRGLTSAAAPFAPLLLSRRLNRGKEHPTRLAERRGLAAQARPRGTLVWIHGASIGEMLAAQQLIERIRDEGFAVLVTSGTVTSAVLAEQRLPAGVMHQFVPIDAPAFVVRFLDHWRPDLALLVESDLWPNLIMETGKRKIPLLLVNGRLSERSYRRWRMMPRTIAALLERFDMCLTQSAADGERFGNLGAPRVAITGNLKLDVPAPPADPARLAALQAAVEGRRVIAAASTHPGEELAILEAHRRLKPSFPKLLTIIAPRHVERGRGIVDVAKELGLGAALRSRGQIPDRTSDVYVADTFGELGLIYRVAPIVFMGGSLVDHGGQNPIEPIKLGAAVLHGPQVWNFAEIYAALDQARGASEVGDPGQIAKRLSVWLTSARERDLVAAAAQETVAVLGGALGRTVAALEPYLMQLRLDPLQRHA